MTDCVLCGDTITPQKRVDLGYRVCLQCGDGVAKQERASWTVVPYTNKGAYMLVTNPEHLKQINPKRTT